MLRRVFFKIFILTASLAVSTALIAEPISPELFFRPPALSEVSLSPNGQWVAAVEVKKNRESVVLVNSKTKSRKVLFDTQMENTGASQVAALVWIDNHHLAAQFVESKRGVKDLIETKAKQKLLVIPVDTDKKVKSVRTSGWLVHPMIDLPGKFLYAKSGIVSKVYTIDVEKLSPVDHVLGKLEKRDGGQFTRGNEVRGIEGYATRWFFQNDLAPVASLSFSGNGKLILTAFGAEEENKVLKEWSADEVKQARENVEKMLIPIRTADEVDSFYSVNIFEDRTQAIYKVNFNTNTEEVVMTTSAYDIHDLITDKNGALKGVQVLRDGVIEYDFINDESDESNRGRQRIGEPVTIILDGSQDANTLLLYRESHDRAGEYILFNEQTKRTELLGEVLPGLNKQLDAKLELGEVYVDGLTIPYLLSTPTKGKAPYPLLVMPHGGPIGVFDDPYFDPLTQYFVANGFAVLRVNYRGSGGRDEAFEEAGRGEWGGKMLEDIKQATLAVHKLTTIDEQRICTLGFSYGGYAAAMLLIRHPEIYRCGASVAAITDLNLYIHSPLVTDNQREWLIGQLGEPENNLDQLVSQSPVFLASQLQRPLLVYHGGKDQVVDKEHAFRLRLALEKAGKPVHWGFIEEAGHSFQDTEHAAKLFGDLLAFMQRESK